MSYDEFADQQSAGGFDQFDFEVTNAFFAIDEKYSAASGADTHFLVWEGISSVENYEQMTRDGFHPKWALDPDFVTLDGGATVVSQSGKAKIGRAAARMMSSAAAAVGEVGVKDTPQDPFAGPDGMSRIAATWVGTKWHMKEIEREFGNGMKARDLLPVAYLGKSGAPVAAAPAPVAAAVPAVAPAPAVAPVAAATPTVDLRSQVVAVANSVSEFSEFVTQAMSIPGVTSDPSLITAISNPAGIWTTKA